MENETFHIRLEAKNPEKSHLRAYSIDAGQDLYGQWNIEVNFGRIGRRGRCDGSRHCPQLSAAPGERTEADRSPLRGSGID